MWNIERPATFCQEMKLIVLDGRCMRSLAFLKDLGPVRLVAVTPVPLRKELVHGFGIKDVARQDVCTNLRALVNDADRQVLVLFRTQLLEANGGGQASRTAPDDQDVKGHALAGFVEGVVVAFGSKGANGVGG